MPTVVFGEPVSDSTMLQFWTKVYPVGDCWEWAGNKNDCGYGRFKVRGKPISAHRFAFTCAHGAIPPGLECCHTCNSRSCVKPEHMYAGTRSQNMHDSVRAGTHNLTKLSPRDVARIRRLRPRGDARVQEVAQAHGISVSHVYRILAGDRRKEMG